MPFTDVLYFKKRDPSARVYLHHTASDTKVRWFEGEDFAYARDGAHKYFNRTIYIDGKFDLSKFAYIIGAVWARGEDKMIDFFGFHNFDKEATGEQWRLENPSVFPGTIKGDTPVPIGWKWDEKKEMFVPDGNSHCEDMDVILGKEAEHRRTTNNLEHYLSEAPDLGRKILFPR